ncbi:MAG: carbamoyl-phosphate synthase large subunit [Actinomycetota bacterium]|nr:carbamoyl-phosphate synthase large subunit [Actinomycetota bacterium]
MDLTTRIGSVELPNPVMTASGTAGHADELGRYIRANAQAHGVPCLTTVAAALAAANGMGDWASHELHVRSLQEYHEGDQLRLRL